MCEVKVSLTPIGISIGHSLRFQLSLWQGGIADGCAPAAGLDRVVDRRTQRLGYLTIRVAVNACGRYTGVDGSASSLCGFSAPGARGLSGFMRTNRPKPATRAKAVKAPAKARRHSCLFARACCSAAMAACDERSAKKSRSLSCSRRMAKRRLAVLRAFRDYVHAVRDLKVGGLIVVNRVVGGSVRPAEPSCDGGIPRIGCSASPKSRSWSEAISNAAHRCVSLERRSSRTRWRTARRTICNSHVAGRRNCP